MGWQIHCIRNTVKAKSWQKLNDRLFEAQCYDGENYGALWEDRSELDCGKQLYFTSEHQEHMDWLGSYSDLVEILKDEQVTGKVVFIDVESGDEPRIWGYSFDGKGNMTNLTGEIKLHEAP